MLHSLIVGKKQYMNFDISTLTFAQKSKEKLTTIGRG